MRNEQPPTTPHAAPDPEDGRLSSGKALSTVKGLLYNGVTFPVRFLKSLRVGTGTGLAPNDGADGLVMANGSSAGFLYGDRTIPTTTASGMLSLTSGVHGLWDSTRGNWLTYDKAALAGQGLASVPGAVTLGASARSVRVGSGSGLDGNLNNDGQVLASGASAMLATGDRTSTSSANYAALILSGGSIVLFSSVSGSWLTHVPGTTATRVPLSSLRVGTGTYTTLDGLDGRIVANGANGSLSAVDRGGAAHVVNFYRNGNFFYFATDDGALIEFSTTTGIITQDALTALTAGTSVTLGYGGWPAPGSRLLKPTGKVEIVFVMNATAAIAATAALATVAAAHRPATFIPWAGRSSLGAARTGYLSSAGVIVCDQALANGEAIMSIFQF